MSKNSLRNAELLGSLRRLLDKLNKYGPYVPGTMRLVEVNSLLASSIQMVGADSCCRIWMCPPQETQGPQTMSLPPDIGREYLKNPALVLAPSDQSPSLQAEIRQSSISKTCGIRRKHEGKTYSYRLHGTIRDTV